MTTRELLEIMHATRGYCEREFNWVLRELEAGQDNGWSEQSLQMIRLQNDIAILRLIADRGERIHNRLIARGANEKTAPPA